MCLFQLAFLILFVLSVLHKKFSSKGDVDSKLLLFWHFYFLAKQTNIIYQNKLNSWLIYYFDLLSFPLFIEWFLLPIHNIDLIVVLDPDDGLLAQFIHADANPLVRATQVLAIISYSLFAESSLQDVVTGTLVFTCYIQQIIWCMIHFI